ncbi:MAG: trehalose-6-phosphate synthase [Trueperaceae bacterium]
MRLLIVANREPIRRQEDGSWLPSVGGLTSALLPVLEERGGGWVAWGEDEVDELRSISYPSDDPRFRVERLPLCEREVRNYYYGFSNRVLWPLCHYFNEQMDIQHAFWNDYQEVNRRFAAATAERFEPGTAVWVHDYHLMLVPGLLRDLLPEARIGFFFHIPWPAPEEWGILPWARELTEGLLGADVVGFHTERYCGNFLAAAEEVPGARVEGTVVHWNGRQVRVEAHPIGIDTARFRELAAAPATRAAAEQIRHETTAEHLLLGVDRLDYTKGVPERLLGFEHFLQHNPDYHERVTFFQISAPSRTRIESYQELKRSVDEIAGRINGTFMRGDWVPVHYFYRSHTQEELVAHYLAADAMLITPFRDGMNIVAQEFALTAERGLLILSHLTGAAEVLDPSILVNPYDIVSISDAIGEAVRTPVAVRRERMTGLRKRVGELDVHLWAERFLASLETR